MLNSKVLQENMQDVNRLLVKASGIGITILYGLSFALSGLGYLSIGFQDLTIASISSYAIYFITLILYRFSGLRKYFHYIFPFELYLTVAIGIYFFHMPVAAFPIWLIPILYAGLYAHRGSMIVTTTLVLITAPVEALLFGDKEWMSMVNDVGMATVVLLILALRMISMVGRSRAIIAKTEAEMEKNAQLQQENAQLMKEVAETTAEVSRVVSQLTQQAQETRMAMNQIASGADDMTLASKASQQVLLSSQAQVEEQVAKAQQIGQATEEAVQHVQQVHSQSGAGEEAVEEMVIVIQALDQHSHETAKKMDVLTERTEEINTFSNAIANIAKNVTVVAINASIEAARAGAAGRTFQVVAAQVQALAKETTEAAEAIGHLAERIKADLSEVMHTIEENGSIVQKGVETTTDAQQKLRLISTAVEEIHLLLQGVANDAKWQQSSANQLASGITMLREKIEANMSHMEAAAASTEETAAIMDENVRIVERLQERSEALQALIAQYGSGKVQP
ncbi:MAG TPA: methyl-accepting chemotaxis protein [Candidatus Bathyarchaeia archaeon]|nr:methyl-accepting chemotaxis protein [Candidatus Bathyarchaeia archaeon]